jgi:predicted transcriptional regulator of viral defense system
MHTSGFSARETALLSSWEREQRRRITVDDLRPLVGANARVVAQRLANKGALQRIGGGVYVIRPFRALLRRASPSATVLAAQLLADGSYYLGGLWGLSFHRLRLQQNLSAIDAFVTRRRRARVLAHARIAFHVLAPPAFSYGTAEVVIEGVAVRVSDAERTVLDLLDFPELAGGLPIAVGLATETIPMLNRKKLIAHAMQGSRWSTCQRLGVLLERAGTPPTTLAPLLRHIRATSSRLSMIPGRPRKGALNPRWRVVENDRPAAE